MARTVDEQMARLLDRIPVLNTGDVNGNRNFLRNTLLELTRDQRHACAEALHTVGHDGILRYDETHQAVMNAEIKG